MRGVESWLELGWRHPVWDLHRFYLSLARRKRFQREWVEELKSKRVLELPDGTELPIGRDVVELFFEYQLQREKHFAQAVKNLRTEDEALDFCNKLGVTVGRTATRSTDHHQSSKSMIAAVTAVAQKVCTQHGTTVESNPQTRCVWCVENELHVSARNLDGAIPALANPSIVWEIKEYWGKTSGGSKMSDAVYECHLVGLELRKFENRSGGKVVHVVFVDGRDQWASRQSDMRRFIDLMNQGFIDYLIVGREVETEWEGILERLLQVENEESESN